MLLTCVCGVDNESGSRFCEACGKPLAVLPAGAKSVRTVGAQPSARRLLVSAKTIPILLLGVAIVAGLFWWLNRPQPFIVRLIRDCILSFPPTARAPTRWDSSTLRAMS